MSTSTRDFEVGGMHCQGCVGSVTRAISRVTGVKQVDVSLDKKSAHVEFDTAATSPEAIVAAIEDAGYDAHAR